MTRSLGICVALVSLVLAGCEPGTTDMWLSSPSGVFSVSLDAATDRPGPVSYEVWSGDDLILASSRLGLELAARSFGELRLVDPGETAVVAESYQLVGREGVATTSHERRAVFENVDGHRLTILFRLFDDSVGIRYKIDEGPPDVIASDLTEFTFANPGKAWIQPHDLPGLATPAYEAYYTNGVDIGHQAPVPSWNLPALFESGEHWVLLAESGTGPGNYGAHLQTEGDLRYRLELPQPSEGMNSRPIGEPVEPPWQSPWRVIVVTSDLGGIVESRAVTNFADDTQLTDTDWIKPGRVSWSWWSDHASARNPEALRTAIDLAAEFGWEYTLIDANWNQLAPGVLESLIEYASERNVAVLLWYNSGGPNNVVPEEPRDRMHDAETRRAEMAHLRDLGIAGLKVDFFHSDRTEMIDLYLAMAADAAAHHLLMNFHGSTVARGWERTLPNLMTVEAVAGAEQYAFAPDYPETAVWHNTILPFTRNVAGPMDYTPVAISNQLYPHLTSEAHELALAVVYSSPLQHFADSKATYEGLSELRREFLLEVPTIWDETRFLAGYPGEYAVLARRSGTRWFVGGINGQDARRVTIDLGFLSDRSDLALVADGNLDERRSVSPNETLVVDLVGGGGFVAWFTSGV